VKCKDPRPPECDEWLEECSDIQFRQAVQESFFAVGASLRVAVSGCVPFSIKSQTALEWHGYISKKGESGT